MSHKGNSARTLRNYKTFIFITRPLFFGEITLIPNFPHKCKVFSDPRKKGPSAGPAPNLGRFADSYSIKSQSMIAHTRTIPAVLCGPMAKTPTSRMNREIIRRWSGGIENQPPSAILPIRSIIAPSLMHAFSIMASPLAAPSTYGELVNGSTPGLPPGCRKPSAPPSPSRPGLPRRHRR